MATQVKPVSGGSFTNIVKTAGGMTDKSTTGVSALPNGGAQGSMMRAINMWVNTGTTAPPGTLAAAPVAGGGTFAAASYFWKVTGLNANGTESAASAEATASVALNGHANLTWAALPAGTTGVNVYRGTVTGQENVLVATLGAVVAYTDTGIAGTAAVPPAAPTATAAIAAVKVMASVGQLLQEV